MSVILDLNSPIVSRLEDDEVSKIINTSKKYLANINGKEKIIKIEGAYYVRFSNFGKTYFSYSYEQEKKQNIFQKLFKFNKEFVVVKPKVSFYTKDFYSEFAPQNVIEKEDLKTVVNW